MSSTYFTSDLHFGHKNVIEFCNRPWTFEEQDEEIIERWNKKVGVMDPVYHLGDFTFKGPKHVDYVVSLINQLNGRIHFIRGNHCDLRLWRLIEDMNIPHIEWIKDYAEIKVGRQKIILSHYAFRHWNNMHHGSWQLHGHSHGSLPPVGKQLDVGIDNHPDFQIFSLDDVRDHMAQQEFVENDHHTRENAEAGR